MEIDEKRNKTEESKSRKNRVSDLPSLQELYLDKDGVRGAPTDSGIDSEPPGECRIPVGPGKPGPTSGPETVGAPGVSMAGVMQLEEMPSLKVIKLTRGMKITPEDQGKLESAMPKVKINR